MSKSKQVVAVKKHNLNNIANIEDAKLTKSEVIDLIIADTLEKLEKDEKDIEAQIVAAKTISAFSVNFVSLLIADYQDPGFANVRVDGYVGASKALSDRLALINKLRKQHGEAQRAKWAFESNRGKAKNYILKNILATSPDGKKLIELIEEYSKSLRDQLMKAVEEVKKS